MQCFNPRLAGRNAGAPNLSEARRRDTDWRSEIDDQLIRSKDVGMNCDLTANAETTEELLQVAAAYARERMDWTRFQWG